MKNELSTDIRIIENMYVLAPVCLAQEASAGTRYAIGQRYVRQVQSPRADFLSGSEAPSPKVNACHQIAIQQVFGRDVRELEYLQ